MDITVMTGHVVLAALAVIFVPTMACAHERAAMTITDFCHSKNVWL